MGNEAVSVETQRERIVQLLRTKMEEKGFNMLALSKEIGKNPAYMQQFFEKGVPKMLGEDVRYALSGILCIDEPELRMGPQLVLPGSPRPKPDPTPKSAEEPKRRMFPKFAPPEEWVPVDAPSSDAGRKPYRLPQHGEPGNPIGQIIDPVDVPRISTMKKDVPVLGTAVGGSDADFEMNGQVIDYVRRPPGIEHARDVFAIYVVGSSMEPRFEEGEMVYVNPKRPARIGDYVLVELHGKDDGDVGRCLIKKLVKRSPAGVVLEQFNPPDAGIQVNQADVKAVHRIMPWVEVLGV